MDINRESGSPKEMGPKLYHFITEELKLERIFDILFIFLYL